MYKCPVEGCSIQYCSRYCQQKDVRVNAHKQFACKRVVPFETVCKYIDVPGCNTGVAARHPIKRGQPILVETSALYRDDDFAKTPRAIKNRVMDLEPRPGGTIVDRFKYNARQDHIFLNFASINHSCIAVAECHYIEEHKIIIVIASQNIQEGEEITVNYLQCQGNKEQN